MKVTNMQVGPRGLNTKDGPVLVEPGQTVDVDLSDAELKVAKGTGWFGFEGGKAKAASVDDGAAKAVHHGGGKFNIVKGDDVLLSGLNKADADAFNAMSDEDKTAYVEASRQ
ncbi:hypothetical protein FJ951_27060 [Mesorhizobium sp. B2-2-3]|uniref:hypothetical protein n=1 Tax=Mesorhizobium sp. B2-2-3 TaxID=2589963 RepID=UPI00112B6CA6|nr:hypothetical protein [Mesorhizobium sp. B2-2-3]TPM39370.1 hypothetical protein FJ951_27060 [Mesorhizobium sp. B2-2-3]